jgi:magnesium chelatase subunit I
VLIPRWVREVVEAVAFAARREKKIDRRSGVSQRLPISALENAVSNAERRALAAGEDQVVPRVSDIYAALPSLTGKFELEYEGELLGAENVARELIREAVGDVFSTYLGAADLKQVVRYFEEGATLRIREGSPAADVLEQLRRVPEVLANLEPLGVEAGSSLALQAAAGEFVLEGLWAQKKIGRSDDRGFVAPERRPDLEVDLERLERLRRLKKQVN